MLQNRDMSIERLSSEIKGCAKCTGLNSEKFGTQNAPGYGNHHSEIVFIGQSLCGKPCIESQIPFTGGSGRLLDQAFERAGVKKCDVYITNVVKCHPPKNRASFPYEIANCVSYLDQELALIKPNEIVCLGKDAWAYFRVPISSPCIREIEIETMSFRVHFLYHPAYIMKKPKPFRENYINGIVDIISQYNRN